MRHIVTPGPRPTLGIWAWALVFAVLCPSLTAAELVGWAEPVTATVDLTATGGSDWAHWGVGSGAKPWFDDKAGGGGQITPGTSINNGPYGSDADSLIACSWSDGSPTASASATTSDVRMINAGDGLRFTVPADTTTRTLRVYVTVHNGGGTFTAHLSDGSAPDYADSSFFSSNGSVSTCYVLDYSASSAAQQLTITWSLSSQLGSWGSANLHAATLSPGAASPAASAPTAPNELSAFPGDGLVTLYWQRISGARTYNLYRSTTGTPPTSPSQSGLIAFTAPSTPSSEGFLVEYGDSTAQNGTTYTYWVSQVDATGHESPLSSLVSATPSARTTSAITTGRMLKVLPLGDSITEGVPGTPTVVVGGYRQTLLNLLGTAGYQVVFMGALTDLSTGISDPHLEGWPGRTIGNILTDVMPRALGDDDPDLVLLMIGTNDLAWGHKTAADVTTAITTYDQLLSGIFTRKPSIQVIVSPILPINNGSDSAGAANQAANVNSFNTQLQTLVQSFATAGHSISWAQAMSAFPTSGDQVDGVHPNDTGYTLMANAWMSAIQAVTSTAAVSAPQINLQPVDQAVSAGQTATFTASATGNPAPSYQWQSAPSGGVFSPISGATASSYTIPSTTLAQSGTLYQLVASNSSGSATSNSATLTVSAAAIPPSISTQPADVAVTSGQTATFTVVASGTGPLTYQWMYGGASVGGDNATLTIANAQAANAGSYTCLVSNIAGSVTSAPATLTISGGSLDPLLVAAALFNDGAGAWGGSANTADKAFDGDTTTFYDCASSNGGYTGIDVGANTTATVTSIRYWARSGYSGRMIGGVFEGSMAQASGYTTLATVSTASDAAWTVLMVTGAAPYRYLRYRGPDGGNCNVAEIEFHGSTTGTASVVAPTISTQPASQTVTAGQDATLTVVANGTAPLTYQWMQGSRAVGTDAPTMTITNAQTANAGSYSVVVSNSAGSITSAPAILTVASSSQPGAPTITSGLACHGIVGQPFSYQITATNNPTSFQAQGLPPGVSIASATGLLSGTPTTAGTSTVTISASNASGQGQALVTVVIAPASGGGGSAPGSSVSSGHGKCGMGGGFAAWILMLGAGLASTLSRRR